MLGVVVVLLAASCGDGGGDSLSKEQYVSELNAMCEDFREREREIGEPRTLDDLVEKGPRILDAFEKTILAKVRELKAPDEMEDQASRLVDIAAQQRDVLAGLVEAAKANDFARVRELASKNEALNEEAASLTHELGAHSCAARST